MTAIPSYEKCLCATTDGRPCLGRIIWGVCESEPAMLAHAQAQREHAMMARDAAVEARNLQRRRGADLVFDAVASLRAAESMHAGIDILSVAQHETDGALTVDFNAWGPDPELPDEICAGLAEVWIVRVIVVLAVVSGGTDIQVYDRLVWSGSGGGGRVLGHVADDQHLRLVFGTVVGPADRDTDAATTFVDGGDTWESVRRATSEYTRAGAP